MKKYAYGMAALLASVGAVQVAPAQAASVYSNNFDNESTGGSTLNYSGFNGLTVSAGTVDLIRSGDFGIACAGGSGGCVDLDGSTNNGGEIQTTNSYAFAAGDLVTLSFDLSGSQRGDGPNPFDAGFRFASSTGLLQFTTGGAYGDSTVFNVDPLTQTVYGGTSFADDPFRTFSLSFRAATSGSFRAYLGTGSSDSIGPVVDNFDVSVAAVPEPATWGTMLLGMVMVGFGLRRRAGKTAARAVLA